MNTKALCQTPKSVFSYLRRGCRRSGSGSCSGGGFLHKVEKQPKSIRQRTLLITNSCKLVIFADGVVAAVVVVVVVVGGGGGGGGVL